MSCNLSLVYWPSFLGLSSWSYISAHCWKCSTQVLCGVEPQGAAMGVKETVLRDVSCQCALFLVYQNSCGFPWVLLGRQALPWSCSCVCHLHLSLSLSWRQTPCPSAQGSFRKGQSYGGQVGIKQGCEEINLPSRTAFPPLGNSVAESMLAGPPRVFTTTWMLAHILLNEKSQPCSELQGESDDYRNHLSSAALVWQPYAPGGNYNSVVCLSCLALSSPLLLYITMR